MKTIKSLLFLSLLFASTSLLAQSPRGGLQQGPPPVPGDKQIEKMVSDLSKNLSLSYEQKTKILELYQAHFKKVKEKMAGNNRPKPEEMQALDAALEKKVKAVLTDNQKSKYETYLIAQRKRRPQARP